MGRSKSDLAKKAAYKAKYNPTPDVAVEDAAEELLKRREARSDLNAFATYVMGYVPALHHKYINKKLMEIKPDTAKRVMFLLPPGSAKSTYASVLFPAWYLGHYPKERVLGWSNTTELAERWGRRVRNLLYLPEYHNLFETRVSADSAAVGKWTTVPGGEYMAAGVGSAILGFRPTLGIIDDPFTGFEQANSELARERIWDSYVNDFRFRLTPTGSIFLIMQRLHYDDLPGRIMRKIESGEEEWEIITLPMEAEENDVLGRKEGERLWSEWYTEEQVEQFKKDPRSWAAQCQQRPAPLGGSEFQREWLQYYESVDHKTLNNYILVDPASGKKKTSGDFTAMVVVGLSRDGNAYLVDAVRERLNLSQRTQRLFDLHEKYKPLKVAYESYGMQADVEHIKTEMERRQYRFPLSEVGGRLKKEDRIRRLIPWFENGKLWLPRTLNKPIGGKLVDLISQIVDEEYLLFPANVGATHDDFLDALSRIEDIELQWPKIETRKKSRNVVYINSGWMGA